MNDSRIVFINFLAGSFGSFLLKCISASPNVFVRTTDSSFFDELGASHHDIPIYLNNFHDQTDVTKWLELPTIEDKINFFKDNWNPPNAFIESDLYYIHRILWPLKIREIMPYFPNAKFINITIPDKYVDVVRHMLSIKRVKVLNQPRPVKVSPYYVLRHRENDTIDGVYNFDVSHLMENTFLNELDKLYEWLNFEKADVSELYEKFKQLNGITDEK
jgi:hypothetical protein